MEPHSTPDTQIQHPPEAQPSSIERAREAWRRVGEHILSITPAGLMRFLLVLAALLFIGWLIRQSWRVLLPFQVGLVLAYLLLPLVNRISRHMPRWAAILTVFALGLLGAMLGIAFIIPPLSEQINRAIDAIPDTERMQDIIDRLEAFYRSLPEETREFALGAATQALSTVRNNIANYLDNTVEILINSALSIFNTFAFILGFLVIPFWLFFVLKDEQAGVRAVDRMLPSWLRPDFWAIARITDRVFSSYIRGQLILGLIVGCASFLGLSFLELIGVQGIQYKLLLAVIAGFTELIPFVGPILGAIPAVAMGLTHSFETALAITALYVVIQQLENNLLVPRVVGESVNIHPAILTVLLIMLAQFGLIWVILAAPVAATLRDIFKYVYGRFQEPPHLPGLLPGEPLPAHMIAPADHPPPPDEAAVAPHPPGDGAHQHEVRNRS